MSNGKSVKEIKDYQGTYTYNQKDTVQDLGANNEESRPGKSNTHKTY